MNDLDGLTLDEFEEMGYLDDIKKIISELAKCTELIDIISNASIDDVERAINNLS